MSVLRNAGKQLLNPSHFFFYSVFSLHYFLLLLVCSPFPFFILLISLKHPFNFNGMAFQYLCTTALLSHFIARSVPFALFPFDSTSNSKWYDMFFIYFSRCIHVIHMIVCKHRKKNLNPQFLHSSVLNLMPPISFCYRIWIYVFCYRKIQSSNERVE